MTPEAAQDLQAYFGMNLFGDDDEEDEEEQQNQQNFDMKEQKLRQLVREQIQSVLSEERQESVKNPKIFRKEVQGETVQDAAGNPIPDGYQYELHFPNGKVLLIQDPDKLLITKPYK